MAYKGEAISFVADGDDAVNVSLRVLLAMFLWMLSLICLLLCAVNFKQRPIEVVAGYAFLGIGLASGVGATVVSRVSRRVKKLR